MADETPPQPEPSPTPKRKKRGRYKPKNGLDGFLFFVIGGKYKHRRYEIFKDYCIRGKKYTADETEQIVDKYQKEGVPPAIYGLFVAELKQWLVFLKKEHGQKANAVRWKPR